MLLKTAEIEAKFSATRREGLYRLKRRRKKDFGLRAEALGSIGMSATSIDVDFRAGLPGEGGLDRAVGLGGKSTGVGVDLLPSGRTKPNTILNERKEQEDVAK